MDIIQQMMQRRLVINTASVRDGADSLVLMFMRTPTETTSMSVTDFAKSALHVMILGETGVGKRAFAKDLIQLQEVLGERPTSFEDGYKWTTKDCEVMFHIIDVSHDSVSDKALKIKLRACDAFILMHLVEDKESFEVLPLIKDIIIKEKGMEADLPIFVVGYRVDCKELVTESHIASVVVWDWLMNYRELFEDNEEHVMKLFGDIMARCLGDFYVTRIQKRIPKRKEPLLKRLRRFLGI